MLLNLIDLTCFIEPLFLIRYTDSQWVTAVTQQTAPENLAPPLILYTQDKNPNKLVVKWNLPEKANGKLQTFQVHRNSSTPLSFPVTQFQFTDYGLQVDTND